MLLKLCGISGMRGAFSGEGATTGAPPRVQASLRCAPSRPGRGYRAPALLLCPPICARVPVPPAGRPRHRHNIELPSVLAKQVA